MYRCPTCRRAFHHVGKVNILHIRALVKSDTVVLFDTYGSVDSRLHSVFLYHLEVSLRAH
jgi:magnesium transporter